MIAVLALITVAVVTATFVVLLLGRRAAMALAARLPAPLDLASYVRAIAIEEATQRRSMQVTTAHVVRALLRDPMIQRTLAELPTLSEHLFESAERHIADGAAPEHYRLAVGSGRTAVEDEVERALLRAHLRSEGDDVGRYLFEVLRAGPIAAELDELGIERGRLRAEPPKARGSLRLVDEDGTSFSVIASFLERRLAMTSADAFVVAKSIELRGEAYLRGDADDALGLRAAIRADGLTLTVHVE